MNAFEGILWLTLNCFKEAAYEPYRAQKAVTHVLINRTEKCGSDFKTEVLRRKQFSWTNNGIIVWSLNDDNSYLYTKCLMSSIDALNERDFTNGSEFYHLKTINPSWAKEKKFTGDFGGSHYFYRDNNNTPDYCNINSKYKNISLIVKPVPVIEKNPVTIFPLTVKKTVTVKNIIKPIKPVPMIEKKYVTIFPTTVKKPVTIVPTTVKKSVNEEKQIEFIKFLYLIYML